MSDLISRQAAVAVIHNLYPSAPIMRRNRERWEEKCKPYIEAEKALERLPSAHRWIPVSERLPDTQIRVMVQMDNGWIITAYRENDKWYSVPYCGDALHNEWVEAWTPLPAPYQKVQ